jgi:hypothetical protein
VVSNRAGIHTHAVVDSYYGSDSEFYRYDSISDLDGNTITFPLPFDEAGWGLPETDTIGRQFFPYFANTFDTTNPTSHCPNLGISSQPAIGWTVRNLVSNYGQTTPDPRYSYTVCYTNVNYHTNSFGGTNGYQVFDIDAQGDEGYIQWFEAIGSTTAIQSVTLPDGTFWGFVYDSVDNPSANPSTIALGAITKVITPKGGAISYCYNTNNSYPLYPGIQGTALNIAFPVMTRRMEQANAGVNLDACSATSGYSSYVINPITAPFGEMTGDATIVDAAGTESHHAFGRLGDTSVDQYEGNGTGKTLLKHIDNTYTSTNLPQPYEYSIYYQATGFVTTQTTSLNGTTVGSQNTSYDGAFTGTSWFCDDTPIPPYGGCASGVSVALNIGQLQSTTTKDASGNVLSSTTNTYQAVPGNSYWDANLVDLQQQVTTADASDSSTTTYSYDDPTYSAGGVKGHMTSAAIDGLYPTYTYWTAALGLVASISDAKGTQVAGYDYDFSSHAINGTIYYAALQPTSITSPIGAEHFTYDNNSGLALTHTDLNGGVTTVQYDSAFRPWTIQYPDARAASSTGQSSIVCYPSSTSVTVYQAQGSVLSTPAASTTCPTSSDAIVTTQTADGLGRPISTVVNAGSGHVIQTDTSYDVLGRVSSVSNPYDGTPTGYSTTATYDGLSRPKTMTWQDGTSRQTDYAALITTVTDEAHNETKNVSDFLGRITDVYEPTAPNTDPTIHTAYGYSLYGLTGVVQYGNGSETHRTRTFAYDTRSRLVCASNPENSSAQCPASPVTTYTAGTTGYSYPASGSLCAGDLSLPCSKEDSRGITTNFTYDSMNRMLSKTYQSDSAGTLSSCYQYDSSSFGAAPNYFLGRLTNEWTQSGSCPSAPVANTYATLRSILNYDLMGRVKNEQQCSLGQCKSNAPFSFAYTYDFSGKQTLGTDGLGTISWQPTYDVAGRLQDIGVTTPWSGPQYPSSLFHATEYIPAGLKGWSIGPQSTPALTFQKTYDNRLRVATETVTGHQ